MVYFLERWGPCTVNASLCTSSEIVNFPRKLQQLWWNHIYPYMVDPLGLTQQNENGFQSNNGKDEDTTPELCKWRRICPEISCSVLWSCMQFVTCSIPKLQMDAVLPENKWNTKMTSNICGNCADTQNKETSSNFPSEIIKAATQWSKHENKPVTPPLMQDAVSYLGPGACLAQRCSDSLQVEHMRQYI